MNCEHFVCVVAVVGLDLLLFLENSLLASFCVLFPDLLAVLGFVIIQPPYSSYVTA